MDETFSINFSEAAKCWRMASFQRILPSDKVIDLSVLGDEVGFSALVFQAYSASPTFSSVSFVGLPDSSNRKMADDCITSAPHRQLTAAIRSRTYFIILLKQTTLGSDISWSANLMPSLPRPEPRMPPNGMESSR